MLENVVLIVEDEPNILDINRQILTKLDLTVLTATTLSQARERLTIAVPDVVVLDIMLPDGSGLDFLEELRGVCDAPVLFLTAKSEQADVIAGLEAGGNDYITKPYDIDEFRMRVMSFLRITNSIKTKISKTSPCACILNKKELAIATLAAQGMSNKDIAERCFLSDIRIRTILTGIYSKLNLADVKDKRAALARILTGS